MAERKEQLKEEIASAQEEVDQWKNKYRSHDHPTCQVDPHPNLTTSSIYIIHLAS